MTWGDDLWRFACGDVFFVNRHLGGLEGILGRENNVYQESSLQKTTFISFKKCNQVDKGGKFVIATLLYGTASGTSKPCHTNRLDSSTCGVSGLTGITATWFRALRLIHLATLLFDNWQSHTWMSLKDLPAAFLRSPSSFCSLLVAAILLFCLLKGQTLWKSKTVSSKNNMQQSKRRQRCFTQHHVEICRSGLESDWAMWCNLTSSFCNVGQINHLEMRKQGWSQNLMETMTLLFLIFIEDFKWEF